MRAKSFENPLIPHRRQRELFTAMVETRILAKRLRLSKNFSPRMEACWVAAAIGLKDLEGDLISGGRSQPLLDYVLGAKLGSVLRSSANTNLTSSQRMYFALGAASRMKTQGKVVLAFSGSNEFTNLEWKRIFTETLRLELPIVFVIVPDRLSPPGLADLALGAGLAGIPVDASDAVAMYRVTQESIGRARSGGGPALIEGVAFAKSADSPSVLAKQLLSRKIATQAWINSVESKFRAKLMR